MGMFSDNAYAPYISSAVRDKTRRDVDSMMVRQIGPESGFAIPHATSIQAIVSTAWRTYLMGAYDEALRDSQANADAMRNDPFLRRLTDERKHAVCSLKCSIEVDNPNDPWQKAVKDSLTQQWKAIPYAYDLNWYLLEAAWYGRYAAQFSWTKKAMDLPALPRVGGVQPGLPAILGAPIGREKREVLTLAAHMPYEGDKIGYDFSGTPYVLISTMAEAKLKEQGADIGVVPNVRAHSMEYGFTTAGGKALFLRSPSWRQRFAIHKGEVLDSPFLDVEKADQVHGIGIRSVIYWYWWLRDEFLANVADWCARTGLGVRIWYYDAGNPQSEAAVDKAARDQSDKVNIKVPRTPGNEGTEGVEFVDTTGSGADLLLRIVRYLDELIELYVVGQSMSRGSQENNNSGFGDRGRADFAMGTKWQITKRDAAKFGDTMTNEVLSVMKRWSLPPDLQEIPARVVYNVDVPDPEKWVTAAKTFIEMGGKIKEDEARSVLGFSSPHEGDAILGGVPPAPPGMGGGGVPVNGEKKDEKEPEGVHLNGKPMKPAEHIAPDRFERIESAVENLRRQRDDAAIQLGDVAKKLTDALTKPPPEPKKETPTDSLLWVDVPDAAMIPAEPPKKKKSDMTYKEVKERFERQLEKSDAVRKARSEK